MKVKCTRNVLINGYSQNYLTERLRIKVEKKKTGKTSTKNEFNMHDARSMTQKKIVIIMNE